MTTTAWHDFETQAPDLADHVRGRIQQHGLALLATLAADGSPRISGVEPIFHDGHLWLAMMPDSVKGRDLHRDGRLALHNATVDKDVTHGDVKIHGTAVPAHDRRPPGTPEVGPDSDLFDVDLTRVATIAVDDDHLVIRTWTPGRPVRTRTRS